MPNFLSHNHYWASNKPIHANFQLIKSGSYASTRLAEVIARGAARAARGEAPRKLGGSGGMPPPGNFCKKHALCCILVPFLTLHSWFQWIHFVYIIPCLLSLHLFRPSLCFEYELKINIWQC